MSTGPGRVMTAVQRALQGSPRSWGYRELATRVYATRDPTRAQTESVRRAVTRLVETGIACYTHRVFDAESRRATYRYEVRVHAIEEVFATRRPEQTLLPPTPFEWRGEVARVAALPQIQPQHVQRIRTLIDHRYRVAMSIVPDEDFARQVFGTGAAFSPQHVAAIRRALDSVSNPQGVECLAYEPGLRSEFALFGEIERGVAGQGEHQTVEEVATALFGRTTRPWQVEAVMEARCQLMRVGQVDPRQVPKTYLPPQTPAWFASSARSVPLPHDWAVAFPRPQLA